MRAARSLIESGHGGVARVVAQAARQEVGDMPVDLRMGGAERVERRAGDEIELRA